MIFRNITATGDWTFGAGKNNYATQDKAIGLNIKTRLQSWVGDCFFDINAGVDWANLLGSKDKRDILEAGIKKVILQSYGVTSIISFNTTLNSRDFAAKYNITTIYSASFKDSIQLGF